MSTARKRATRRVASDAPAYPIPIQATISFLVSGRGRLGAARSSRAASPFGQGRAVRYLKLRTPVSDAAFHIVYHDNSGGLPGPSDWSIAAVVKVTPADGPVWLAGARQLSSNETLNAQTPATA